MTLPADRGKGLAQAASDHVVIVGPGAMGCLHAALLSRAPNVEVSLLDHRPARAEHIQRRGVIVETPDGIKTVPVSCTADPLTLPPADLLLVFTKAYDTEAALVSAAPLISSRTAVLTLQNGLGNYQTCQQHVSPGQVLAGTTSSGATLLGPGRIRQAAVGEIVLGSPAGNSELAQRGAALLESAGLMVSVTHDVEAVLWCKAVINCAINPLTALTRRRNGELLEIAPLRELMVRVACEVHTVAAAAGVDLKDVAPAALVKEVCAATATNQSSMLQDVLAGRRTEIDYINGAVANVARDYNIRAPLCECLAALIEGITASPAADDWTVEKADANPQRS